MNIPNRFKHVSGSLEHGNMLKFEFCYKKSRIQKFAVRFEGVSDL